MLLALDVYYKGKDAKSVGVIFEWEDATPKSVLVENITEVEDYAPGAFYKRELPCLLKVIDNIDIDMLEAIIVDGHVYTDNELNHGLGGKLFEALEKNVPVIGVAKTPFYKNESTVMEVRRGLSANPLYISAIGIDKEYAAQKILSMHGDFRIPTMLKSLDSITKNDF